MIAEKILSKTQIVIEWHLMFCRETWRKKRPLGRPRQGWKDNIKIDLTAVGCINVDERVEVAEGRSEI